MNTTAPLNFPTPSKHSKRSFGITKNLKISTSLLDWDALLCALSSLVGLVDLGPLSEGGRFQITTVENIRSILLDGANPSVEITSLDRNDSLGLARLVGGLGSSLLDQFGLVFGSADDIVNLGVGDSGEFEKVQGLDVSLLCAELNGTRSLGASILLVEEGVVALGDFPHQRIWTEYHSGKLM